VFGNLGLSNFPILRFFYLATRFNYEWIFFLHNSLSSSMSLAPRASGMTTVESFVAPTVGTTTLSAAVEVAPELAAGDMHQTPEGVPEDVLEDSEEEPEMVLEPVPEVIPVEEAMIVVHVVAPSPPHATAEVSSPAPHAAAVMDTAANVVGEPEVVMGHPAFHATDDIPLDEAVSTAHRALSQA
jgi:hypothetical protein